MKGEIFGFIDSPTTQKETPQIHSYGVKGYTPPGGQFVASSGA
jgi:hypothetical protein